MIAQTYYGERARSDEMSVDTATARVEQIVRGMVAEAYGSPASPAVYYCECDHPQSAHEGDDWDGACTEDGCGCQEHVDAER
jgi:hypothetical protein